MSLKAIISRSALSYTQLAAVKSQIIPCIVTQTRCLSDRIVDPPDLTPPIPEYVERSDDEPTDVRRARLLYQSRKRGMAENCLLLSTFAKKHLHTFDSEQLKQYDDLINKPSNDWELYYWMTGTKPTPDEYNNAMMDMLKEHARNDDRDARIEQPPL